jgi:hypothetical protein
MCGDLMMVCRNRLMHDVCRTLVVSYDNKVVPKRKVPFEVKVSCFTTKK